MSDQPYARPWPVPGDPREGGDMWKFGSKRGEWIQQPDVLLNQVPVQNTWYEVLPYTGRYTLIENIFITIRVANEDLEIEVMIDGLTKLGSIAGAVVGTGYQARDSIFSTSVNRFTLAVGPTCNLDRPGHNVRVRARKTTAAGAGTLECKVVYAVQ